MEAKLSDLHRRCFERHVVLVSPDVHWNTGNIGRTCLGVNAHLHLIEPLGFSLESRQVKRAGLDYWPRVKLAVWKNFAAFREEMIVQKTEMAIFTKMGIRDFRSMPSSERLFLVFGSESRGLPKEILSTYFESTYYIPISDQIRSLNLSTAAGIALYESLRTCKTAHAWKTTEVPTEGSCSNTPRK